MPQSMSQSSLPSFEITLNALSAVLDKAEAFAKAKKVDAAVLLRTRLAPDMFDLTRQVQIATDQARRGAARLAGVEAPSAPDNETSIAELKDRIAKTVAFVKGLDRKAVDASAEREITFPLGPEKKGHMKGDDYLNHFVLSSSLRTKRSNPERRRRLDCFVASLLAMTENHCIDNDEIATFTLPAALAMMRNVLLS
jgi:hypothetical protein